MPGAAPKTDGASMNSGSPDSNEFFQCMTGLDGSWWDLDDPRSKAPVSGDYLHAMRGYGIPNSAACGACGSELDVWATATAAGATAASGGMLGPAIGSSHRHGGTVSIAMAALIYWGVGRHHHEGPQPWVGRPAPP